MKKLLALAVALVLVMSLATIASAAEYPTKGISVICPWGAGGGTDSCLRAFSLALEKQLGVTLTVDNLTGAGGVIGHHPIAIGFLVVAVATVLFSIYNQQKINKREAAAKKAAKANEQ